MVIFRARRANSKIDFQGLNRIEIPSLSENRFLNRKSAVIGARSSWLHAICGLAESASKIGRMYISLEWGHESHAVVLTGYDPTNERFIFSKPHGEDPSRANGDLIAKSSVEPERFIVDNEFGIQAMTRATFEELLQAAILRRG